MITCTVHERQGDTGDLETRAQKIVFVREGLAWWALLFPAFWLLFHRLWLELIVFLALMFAITAGLGVAGVPETISGIVTFLLSLIVAFEGNDLRRMALSRKGYQLADVVTGRDQQECEQKFFEDWLTTQQASKDLVPAARPRSSSAKRPPLTGDDVIGLFPEAGR